MDMPASGCLGERWSCENTSRDDATHKSGLRLKEVENPSFFLSFSTSLKDSLILYSNEYCKLEFVFTQIFVFIKFSVYYPYIKNFDGPLSTKIVSQMGFKFDQNIKPYLVREQAEVKVTLNLNLQLRGFWNWKGEIMHR